ncbi:hypothetical protein Xcel_0580 [Xylanimonas cellulosilytica DSM 15894]|uniref:Uncharacterized protein n=1 Tax=Xylanimonas cellulosilytica (strain DSM 15894 / JCM 12276 / CECT 5975 / KCTC 9989 / LMG 20990 / NBRC 107835 / XIL07) TaxID=446471 RepID=D1BWN7_XYLCX|nr:hypothetical protein [Xylanimonas cellulosilytica]ACZ29619.1 hypothetical protein Xcel_0580 [Xylanimonas cellulosilytica DSM 15894]
MTTSIPQPQSDTEIALRGTQQQRADHLRKHGPAAVRADLEHLKRTLQHQRTIKAGWVADGVWTTTQYNAWVGRQATVELHVDNWLHDLAAVYDPATAVLADAIHRYLEDADASDDILEDALDESTIPLGDRPAITVRDAIAQGLLPHTQGR